MHVAVTGGSGQLGSLVLRRLIDDRSVKSVVSLDLRPPRVAGKKLRFIEADVRDPDFARHLAGCDAIVHLAFVVIRKLPREVFEEINVRGSENVFRAAHHAGIRQLVYASSVAAYGVVEGHPRPLTEEAPRVRQPEFPYACAKYDVEAFLDRFEHEHPELNVARLRPGILVGARIEHPGSETLKHRLLLDVGGGPMPLVWDDDVAAAAVLALHARARGAFNLVADDPRPTAELAKASGLRLLRLPGPVLRGTAHASALLEKLGLGEAIDPAWMNVTTDMVVSSEKACRELGWERQCPTMVDVLRRFDAEAPRLLHPRIAVLMRIAGADSRRSPQHPELAGLRARFHLALNGREGGDFILEVEDQRVHVRAGTPRPPDGTLSAAAPTFIDVLAGRNDLEGLQRTGKLRVEGDPRAAMALDALIRQFREHTGASGPRGWVSRRFAHWLAPADESR